MDNPIESPPDKILPPPIDEFEFGLNEEDRENMDLWLAKPSTTILRYILAPFYTCYLGVNSITMPHRH